MTNPDQSILNFDDENHPVRGIRTLGEIAHFVRCIPFQQREGLTFFGEDVWTSPDFTLNIKTGTEFDHALLMASLMRTCKHETAVEFKEWTKEMKKKRTN